MKKGKIGYGQAHKNFNILMHEIKAAENLGDIGISWAKVLPGEISTPHQHNEKEIFVITGGSGILRNGQTSESIEAGDVIYFNHFETHSVHNTGNEDLVFADIYWKAQPQEATDAQPQTLNHFVISTPPTPNGDLHLGHLSGPYLGADVFKRFQNMIGNTVYHITGSDDYQSYVESLAKKEQQTPAEIATHYSQEIQATLKLLDVEIDHFTVTNTAPEYHQYIQDCCQKLLASESIQRHQVRSFYDAQSGEYLYEPYLNGHCPNCGAACSGNMCEECGHPNVCVDLVNPENANSDAPLEIKAREHHTIDLTQFEESIRQHHAASRMPPRIRQLSEELLQKESLIFPISHYSNWGIPFDADADPQEILWVWPEMSFGFLYGIETLGKKLNKDWSDKNTWKISHFFGYDNSFYHSFLYPALYQAAFPDWDINIDYHYNEFFLLENKKFSTSRRHAIWGKEILTENTVDAVRFYLSLNRSETRRTNFDIQDFRAFVNDTLGNQWLSWIDQLKETLKNIFDGQVPDTGMWLDEHHAFSQRIQAAIDQAATCYAEKGFSLNGASQNLLNLVADCIGFAEYNSHLSLSDNNKSYYRTAVALQVAALRCIAQLASPIMPRFSAQLYQVLGEPIQSAWQHAIKFIEPNTQIDFDKFKGFDLAITEINLYLENM